MSKKVLIPIADGTEEIEAATVIDVLRRAGAEVTVASVGSLQVTASRGMQIVADRQVDDCAGEIYDLIALPGGMPGSEHLRDCTTLIELLKAQHAAGRLVAAVCAAPAVVLATYGLLDGKRATCYPSLQSQLPDASTDAVVVDGHCVTSQGPGTAMAFAVELVRQLFGPAKARTVADALLWAV